jgi:hypothetical protein
MVLLHLYLIEVRIEHSSISEAEYLIGEAPVFFVINLYIEAF